jgi:hypothetical protein
VTGFDLRELSKQGQLPGSVMQNLRDWGEGESDPRSRGKEKTIGSERIEEFGGGNYAEDIGG